MSIPKRMTTDPTFDSPDSVKQRATRLSENMFPSLVALSMGYLGSNPASLANLKALYLMVSTALAAVGVTPEAMGVCFAICGEAEALSLDALMMTIKQSQNNTTTLSPMKAAPLDPICIMGHGIKLLAFKSYTASLRLAFQGRMAEAAAANRALVRSTAAQVEAMLQAGLAHPTVQSMFNYVNEAFRRAANTRHRNRTPDLSVTTSDSFGRLGNTLIKVNCSALSQWIVRWFAELEYRAGMVHDHSHALFSCWYLSTVMNMEEGTIAPWIVNVGPPGMGKSFAGDRCREMCHKALVDTENHTSGLYLTGLPATLAIQFSDDAPRNGLGMEGASPAKRPPS